MRAAGVSAVGLVIVAVSANTVHAQDETIAASSVHNAPVQYSTLTPLAWRTDDWPVIAEGRLSSEVTGIGIDSVGRDFSTIGFVPTDGNAMCDHVDVLYDDQSMQTIPLAREGLLNEAQFYEIEFGVDPRHVEGLTLNCRAVSAETTNLVLRGEIVG